MTHISAAENRLAPPANDEIEISLFGPGYGESVVVHLGDSEWLVVDSCVDSRKGSVAPLEYLRRIGVDVTSDVKLIVASHWHDDHVRGLSELVEACTSARFCCALAMTETEFREYASLYASASIADTPGTSEIVRTFLALRTSDRRRCIAAPNAMLHENRFGTVFSLSPSAERHDEFLAALAKEIPSINSPQRHARKLTPNHLAVAIWLRMPHDAVLLGADLEEEGLRGWSLVLQEQICVNHAASVFKVAHHGSKNAHHDDIWARLCHSDVVSVLTPFTRGRTPLPTPSDVDRISGLSRHSFSTASLQARAPRRRDASVEKELKEKNIRLRAAQPPTGHIRLRKKAKDIGSWDVKLSPGAVPLTRIHSA